MTPHGVFYFFAHGHKTQDEKQTVTLDEGENG